MKSSKICLAFSLSLLLLSCGKSNPDNAEKLVTTDQTQATETSSGIYKQESKLEEPTNAGKIKSAMSSNAAVLNIKDTTHQFVRTADLKFKVNDVIQATYAIENIVAKENGFVTYTHLHSQVNEVIETPIGTDSLLEITKFSIVNSIVIRVPNAHLDTVLKSMANLVAFLDYRIIKADDVALQLKANRLTNLRNNNSAERLTQAVVQQRGKLNDINTVEETIYERESAADAARIQNLALRDKVDYSTINIELYQHPGIQSSMVMNDKNIYKYEPSLAHKLWHSLKFGWHILESILLFLVKFWSLAIIGTIVFFAIKKFRK